MAGAGGYCYLGTQDLLKNGVRSTGKVVELRRTGKGAFSPVIQFETPDHRNITTSSKVSSNPPTHQVGDSVTVLYRAESPEDVSLDEPLDLWFITGILGGLGTIFIIIGGALLIFLKGTVRKSFEVNSV